MERVAFTLQIRDGCTEEYVKRHRRVWPELFQEMEKVGIRCMHIFLEGHKTWVFMEVEDYSRAVEALSRSSVSLRWEEYMAPMMVQASGKAYDPEKPYPKGLPEVFSWQSRRKAPQIEGIKVLGSMPLSGASWSFVGTSLEESAAIYRTLGVNTIDLLALAGASRQPQIDSRRIIEEPQRMARRIGEVGSGCANIIFFFGSDFFERALNHKDPRVRRRNLKEFPAVLEFCASASIPSITLLPGMPQEGWSTEKSLAISAEVLNEMAAMADKRGITVTFEAHVSSILESPREALIFMQANPRLKLTLDFSHFAYLGYPQEEGEPLVGYTGHVHLRQAGRKEIQARWNQGQINFKRIITKLQLARYTGFLALEYEHDEGWLDMDQVDVMTETIKMRDFLCSLTSEAVAQP